jgi:hypothetical protein
MVSLEQRDRLFRGLTLGDLIRTLQEGYFGIRKLIFTDYQITYICEHGICNESISPRITWDSHLYGFRLADPRNRGWLLADEHECGRHRTLRRLNVYFSFEDSHSRMRSTDSTDTEFWKWQIIGEFTKRKLSYDSDVYNASCGIFSSWSKAEPSGMVGHICGIPVADHGLSLAWEVHGPSSRREGFPTWSWLSRVGPISALGGPALASISIQTRGDVDSEAVTEKKAVPLEKVWVSITEYAYQGTVRARPSGADDSPRLLRLIGWCPRVCMERQSDDPSQYLKQSECTIKKSNGRVRFEASNVSLDRQDLTQKEWESCVAVLIALTGEESFDTPLTLRNRSQNRWTFLLLCHTTGKDIYERVGVFHAWLQDDLSTFDLCEDCVETPDWEESGCHHGNYAISWEDLDVEEDLLVVGLGVTHDLRQGLFRTQEDRATDYNFAEDPYRFTEEPDEAFEDNLVFPLGFPDWERRVLIVQ